MIPVEPEEGAEKSTLPSSQQSGLRGENAESALGAVTPSRTARRDAGESDFMRIAPGAARDPRYVEVMGRGIAILILAASAWLGCAGFPVLPSSLPGAAPVDPRIQQSTGVSLSEANYRVVQTGVQAQSSGLTLLLVLRVIPTSSTLAVERLYREAGLEPGGAWALANVVFEVQGRNFLLFALPRVRVRADVVEFQPGP